MIVEASSTLKLSGECGRRGGIGGGSIPTRGRAGEGGPTSIAPDVASAAPERNHRVWRYRRPPSPRIASGSFHTARFRSAIPDFPQGWSNRPYLRAMWLRASVLCSTVSAAVVSSCAGICLAAVSQVARHLGVRLFTGCDR